MGLKNSRTAICYNLLATRPASRDQVCIKTPNIHQERPGEPASAGGGNHPTTSPLLARQYPYRFIGFYRFYGRYQLHRKAHIWRRRLRANPQIRAVASSSRGYAARSFPRLKFQGEYPMKQFLFLMAVVGLVTTGCAQSRVMGPHARRGGANFNVANSQAKPQSGLPKFFQKKSKSGVEQVGFLDRGGCNDSCCGEAECGYPDQCCDEPCCGTCDAGCGCNQGCCDAGCKCAGGCDCGCGDGGYCSCGDGSCGLGGGGCSNDSCGFGGGSCNGGGCSTGNGGFGGGGCNGSGCSACGGAGCGLCQRIAGRIAGGCCPHSGGYPADYNYTPSPPTGQVAYPYYTVRGPRDFLRNNPPSIGPY